MRTILIVVLLLGVALAQEETAITESDTPVEVAPGISVTVTTGAAADEPLEVARAANIVVHPERLHEAIPYDREVARLNVQVTSRAHTNVRVETDHPDELVSISSRRVRLVPGGQTNVAFTAFEPHEGMIRIYNTEGDLLESIPYVVTKQSGFQQTVRGTASTGVSTDFDEIKVEPVDLRFGYGIRERSSGVGGQATLGYEAGGNLDLDVSVSGSYSW